MTDLPTHYGRTRVTAPKPLFVRVSDAKEMFGVHRATIYRWAEAGKLTIHKVGSVSLLSVAEMEAMITGGKSA